MLFTAVAFWESSKTADAIYIWKRNAIENCMVYSRLYELAGTLRVSKTNKEGSTKSKFIEYIQEMLFSRCF
jgi:hypothetical protein